MSTEDRERLERIKTVVNNGALLHPTDGRWVVALACAREFAFTQALKQLEAAEAMNDGLAAEIDRLRDALGNFAESMNWTIAVTGEARWCGQPNPWIVAEKALNPLKKAYVFHASGDAEMTCKFYRREDADAFAAWLGEHAGWRWTQGEVEE